LFLREWSAANQTPRILGKERTLAALNCERRIAFVGKTWKILVSLFLAIQTIDEHGQSCNNVFSGVVRRQTTLPKRAPSLSSWRIYDLEPPREPLLSAYSPRTTLLLAPPQREPDFCYHPLMSTSWHWRMKKSGLCQGCGRRPPQDERTLCHYCLRDRRARANQRSFEFLRVRIERRLSGMCEYCGDQYSLAGNRLCFDCHQDAIILDELEPPKPSPALVPRTYIPVVVWSLRRGRVHEYLSLDHANFVASEWKRQDNPVTSKRLRPEDIPCRKKWPLAS
jgi:hypothetical protein